MANQPDRGAGGPWDDGDAAEYVLGTLDAEERRQAAARYRSDPVFAEATRAWEARIASLAEGLAEAQPTIPPASVWAAIQARINEGSAAAPVPGRPSAAIVDLRKRVRYWKGATGLAAALAAMLAVGVFLPPGVLGPDAPAPVGPDGVYYAVLQPGEEQPAFVAEVDLASGTVSLRPLRPPAPPRGQAYEMWVVGGGRARPVSLGLLAEGGDLPLDALQGPVGDSVLAVSVEPPGGSPTGQPTGPVVFTGELIRAD